MKICVLGYSGSGKSTMAKFLSKLYNIPLLYLDKVQFLPEWKERDEAEKKEIVFEFMKQKDWIIDGNYAKLLQERRLQESDSIVFLEFNRFLCLARAWKRYCRHRNTTRESMTDGCKEKFDIEFIRWILYEGRSKKKQKEFLCIKKEYKEKMIVLRNQKELDAFIVKKCFTEL